MHNIFLYLGRRDKSDVKILAKLKGVKQPPNRLTENLQSYNLNLSDTWTHQLSETIYDNRMLWEPWLESASSYEELRSKLRQRGYKNIPMIDSPILDITKSQIPVINTSFLPQKKSMVQKN